MNQLTKSSSSEEIKAYFNAILKLAKASEKYPVNLDEVWMLVYGRKEEAVRSLTSDPQFIEGVDYQVLRRNAEQIGAEIISLIIILLSHEMKKTTSRNATPYVNHTIN